MAHKTIMVDMHAPLPERIIQEPDFFTAHKLSVAYGKEKILNEVSFSVGKGSLCGLMGPNGAGKSTLFKCCMNFLNPQQGRICIAGKETNQLSPVALARLVSYVPQEQKMVFPFTVREMVSMGRNAKMKGFLRLSAHDYEVVDYVIEQMGIQDLAHKAYTCLSGGQRQLTLIARALAQEAPLILLDEPTSSLDFTNQLIVWRALNHIANSGVTIMVCCHDPNHILWFCDDVLVMKQGEIMVQASPKTIGKEGFLSSVYGEVLRCGMIEGVPVVYPFL